MPSIAVLPQPSIVGRDCPPVQPVPPGAFRGLVPAVMFCIALAHDQWARRRTLIDDKPRSRWVGGHPRRGGWHVIGWRTS